MQNLIATLSLFKNVSLSLYYVLVWFKRLVCEDNLTFVSYRFSYK